MVEGWTRSLELGDRGDTCARARRFVAGMLAGRSLDGLADAAVLATSEVVANAVRYGVPPLELYVRLTDDLLEVAVTDHAPARAPRPPEAPAGELEAASEELTESGRGMMIVEALVTRWGWHPEGDRKFVWFQLRLPPAGQPPGGGVA